MHLPAACRLAPLCAGGSARPRPPDLARRQDKRAREVTYSADELQLVQRDIGRLALYTIEMGGGIELIETALGCRRGSRCTGSRVTNCDV